MQKPVKIQTSETRLMNGITTVMWENPYFGTMPMSQCQCRDFPMGAIE